MAASRKAKAKSKARPGPRRPVSRRAGTKAPAIRRRVAARKAPAAARTAKTSRLAGVGAGAVMKATGRAWDEWLALLDKAGARKLAHKEIALMLSRRYSVPGWWSQMISVGYEQARGLRLPGQKADGFSATASKTVAAGLPELYAAWSDPVRRARWLPGAPLEVSGATEGKSIRMRWTLGGSRVVVGFASKGAGKSVVALEHGQLRDAAAAAAQKVFWSEALSRLKAFVEAR